MKLVFPNGEHSQVWLSPGVNSIGSDPEGAVVLAQPGIQPAHCTIHVTATGANLQVPAGGGPASVNGKPVTDIMALRPGDTLGFGTIMAKYAIVEAARPYSSGMSSAPNEDNGATRVRMAVPKYMLRGVSGAVFGKVYPVSGPTVIGRAVECDISVTADEISRRHALVKPTQEGLSVEDLGSANGTYINNKRVQQGFLNPGDELRLDAVRFIMVAPGMEMAAPVPVKPAASAPMVSNNKIQIAAMVLTFAALASIVVLLLTKK